MIYELHKQNYNRCFVESDDPSEKQFIISAILKQFSGLHHESVERAIGLCSNCIKPPRPSRVFFECLKNNIGKV